jgi:serine/threonine-protein kinase HipA
MTLFGSHRVPIIDVEVAKLHTFALAMVGHTSISGVQRKISLRLPVDRSRLHVAAEHGQYILKPQASSYPSLPENEHVTMLIARRLGVTVPPLGLMRLRDQTLAYLVKRFDRLEDGTKLLQEDFCQLAEKPPKDRYSGSAELCARLVTRYANEPIVEALNLFRLTVCLWWTGNGDMHLKNFSLLRGTDGIYALSPAYDLLCTRLVIKDDLLALSVDGNKKNVTPRQWASFAKACLLPERAAVRVLRATVAAETDARDLIARSYLPTEMKNDYSEQLKKRTKLLAAAVKA